MDRLTGLTITNNYSSLEDLPRGSTELTLRYCGLENCKPGHYYGPIIRNVPMCFVFFDGTGIFKVNDTVFTIGKNHCFLIFPGENVYFETDIENPWSNVFIAFTGSRMYEYIKKAGFTREKPFRYLRQTASYLEYINNILKLHQLTTPNEIMRNVYLTLFLSDLIEDYDIACQQDKKVMPIHKTAYIQECVDYLVNNYQNKIRISNLSDILGISRNYLATTFKSEIGMSPQEYLIDIRMTKAADLLKNTDYTIREVAVQVGYTDQFLFSRIFKKWSNTSPLEYRKSTDKLFITETRDEYKSRTR